MHVLLVTKILANLRGARNKGKFLSGSMLALCNQPTADVLSPKLKKHSSGFILSYKIACQIEMIDAKNSKQLFLLLMQSLNLSGIW